MNTRIIKIAHVAAVGLILLVLAVMAVAARRESNAGGQNSNQSGGAAATVSSADRKFATMAAMGGMAEVELGNLAQQNAQSDEVKQFGARMVRDHSAANQQLMRIVATKDATMPTQLDEQHRKVFEKLSEMRGAEFDRAYMRQMVEDHEKTIKKFREEAQQGNDPDLKAFAQSTMPVLEQHHKLAQDINKSLTAVGSSGQTQGQRNR
jgi:putative membrane protein